MGREARAKAKVTSEAGSPLAALHEASHAVVAHALGLRIKRFVIERGCTDGVTDTERGTFRENALVGLAGVVETERQARQFGRGGGGDAAASQLEGK